MDSAVKFSLLFMSLRHDHPATHTEEAGHSIGDVFIGFLKM